MAGSFALLTFSNRTSSCVSILDRMQSFAKERMTFRCVMRLEGNQPIFGQRPHEWQETGLTPADLGLDDDEWYTDVVEDSRQERLSIEQALQRWPVGPWVGLCVKYDVPPGRDGFPSIYGACWWRIWFGSDSAWRHTASIEYPTRSVRADERWPAWLQDFVADAEMVFDASVIIR